MGAGRPTDYNEEVQAKAYEYAIGGHESVGDAVPSIAGLACELGVNRSTLYEWKREYRQFSDTLDLLMAVQERLSLSGGLRGDMNSTIVKLLLANHGYGDKVEQSHVSPDGSMSPNRIELVAPDDDSTDTPSS